MAYSNNFRRGGSRTRNTAARLTGLFRTRRRELLVGTVNNDQLDSLITKIKEATKQKAGLTIFCWKNTKGDLTNRRTPLFNLSAEVAQPMEERSSRPQRRVIEDDPDDDPIDNDEPEADDDEDDPFV